MIRTSPDVLILFCLSDCIGGETYDFCSPAQTVSFLVTINLLMVYLTTLSVTQSVYPHMIVLMSSELEEVWWELS